MTDPHAPDSAGHGDEALAFDDATIATLEALDTALDELREHDDSIPEWEFCEGFMTALLCTRREIAQDEWLPVLLGGDGEENDGVAPFASAGQRTRFLMHWLARESQVRTALQAQVDDLSDPRALEPAVLDWRGMLAALPPEALAEEPEPEPGPAPSYGQLWAMGFLAVVDIWDGDWAPPRDKDIAADMEDALGCIAVLTEDDHATPRYNLFDEQAPPSVSEQRMHDFGEAIFAAYDLHAIARALGPRVLPVLHPPKVGRNDPCPCGSGKKYKKCCGA
ncbi:MAG TPA: UPF0149 family protein [Ottowia sp.]|uniref:UPF0149 family protein n=1 Tax=Ottowia sp. TaxID=1898956 RepID=UPI002B8861E8|nr:UPF0149 family protein [Ottowia sp.]HMN20966.1 UPF0149 family protein [Ottowia sp.]